MGRSCVIIPARLASTRLPGKLLLCETGKPVIQYTYEAACRAKRPVGVYVATGDREIFDVVAGFGGRVELTDPLAMCGTDRVAEVARGLSDIDIVVNVQGDEPEVAGEWIDLVVQILEERPLAVMATLAAPVRCWERFVDRSCVKVVCDGVGRALYFSRSAIPFGDVVGGLQHIGVYAYRRDFLLGLAQLPQSRLELVEGLEQLRVLEAGFTIWVGVVDGPAFGIDTIEDYRAFVARHA